MWAMTGTQSSGSVGSTAWTVVFGLKAKGPGELVWVLEGRDLQPKLRVRWVNGQHTVLAMVHCVLVQGTCDSLHWGIDTFHVACWHVCGWHVHLAKELKAGSGPELGEEPLGSE